MRTWELPLAVDPDAGVPVFLQLARGVADAVRGGRLKPGDVLPGTRAMADQLGVHRNTVIAAWSELRAEGWIETRPGGGTFVSRALPDVAPRPFAPPGRATSAGFDVPDRPGPWDPAPRLPLSLGEGSPDVRLIPADALARAWRRALRARKGAALAYADPRGHPKLLDALTKMLASTRGVTTDPSRLMVTRGSQQALDLVSRVLLAPGDVVAVEALGYPPAWTAMRMAGAELVAVPIDGEGLRVDALEALCDRRTVRAVYVTPHHQYPTTVTMSPARRLALLDLARRKRIAVLEDDYDHEFHYDGRPILPLASADRHGVVVYVGTLSKILAPGLRLGFVAGPAELVDRLVRQRLYADRQGDQVMEAAVAEIVEDGELLRHARRMRQVYGERRRVFADLLRRELGDVVRFDLPAGGMALWADVDPSVDVEAWKARCAEKGVGFRTAKQYRIDGVASPQTRLGFAALSVDELEEAVRRMKAALAV